MSTFTKKTVDPDSIEKDERFSDKFKIEIHFRDICQVCKPTEHFEKLCTQCKYEMQEEIPNWQLISKILEDHDYPNHDKGVLLNFNSN